jgi:deoxyribodipyrimidine photo-lyase
MKRENVNIFLHRRDLRVQDNTSLSKMINTDPLTKVLHVFIFNPQQIDPQENKYYSKNAVEFMVQSLQDLNQDLNDSLHCFHGTDKDVLTSLLKHCQVNMIGFNLDYTPFARKRDIDLLDWCHKKDIVCICEQDYTLLPITFVKTDKGDPYEVFTPFYNKCIANADEIPSPNGGFKYTIYRNKQLPGIVKNVEKYYLNEPNYQLAVQGGRKHAMTIIKQRITKGYFANYDKYRDFPSVDKTTKLSAYLKFGCVSIREVFSAIRKRYGLGHGLIRELFWREFYANVAYHFPRVLKGQTDSTENQAFKEKYDAISWTYDHSHWMALITGKTGFPMVDAGVRQLLTTGWCHNRSRMIIAMFASKDLQLPPQLFEKWFATCLVDYDPCSNSGGVQWAYGIGSDAQPYFRIFNPFTQSVRYDPETTYIKQWIPELRNVPPEDILQWDRQYKTHTDKSYPPPIVNHSMVTKKIKAMFAV